MGILKKLSPIRSLTAAYEKPRTVFESIICRGKLTHCNAKKPFRVYKVRKVLFIIFYLSEQSELFELDLP